MATTTKTKTNGKHKPVVSESLDLSTVQPGAPERHSAKSLSLDEATVTAIRVETARTIAGQARGLDLVRSLAAPAGTLERQQGAHVVSALRAVAAAERHAHSKDFEGGDPLTQSEAIRVRSALRSAWRRAKIATLNPETPADAVTIARLKSLKPRDDRKDSGWEPMATLNAELIAMKRKATKSAKVQPWDFDSIIDGKPNKATA